MMAASRPRPGRACAPQPTCEVGCFTSLMRHTCLPESPGAHSALCPVRRACSSLGACGRGPTGPSGLACVACLRARRDKTQPWRGRLCAQHTMGPTAPLKHALGSRPAELGGCRQEEQGHAPPPSTRPPHSSGAARRMVGPQSAIGSPPATNHDTPATTVTAAQRFRVFPERWPFMGRASDSPGPVRTP